MININQTSEQTKILIPRSNINGDIEKNNYVTEDELQEQLKNINIPYLVVDHIRFENGDWGYGIVSGDFDKVYDAIVNQKPQIMYVPSQQPTTFYIPTVFGYDTSTKKILAAVSHHNAVDLDFVYYIFEITENLVTQSYQRRKVQEKLVSGENIKTINGNDILGEGDIIIESGGNIVELTQSEYNSITPEPDTLYVISDAPAVEIPDTTNFVDKETLTYEIDAINIALNQKQDTLVSGQNIKTINNQSIIGSGNITIEGGSGNIVELTQSEYNAIIPDSDTLYLISDSDINTTLKTINGESIIGEGDIKVEASVDLTGYATEQWVEDKGYAKLSYVDEQIGNINNVLENIIG